MEKSETEIEEAFDHIKLLASLQKISDVFKADGLGCALNTCVSPMQVREQFSKYLRQRLQQSCLKNAPGDP